MDFRQTLRLKESAELRIEVTSMAVGKGHAQLDNASRDGFALAGGTTGQLTDNFGFAFHLQGEEQPLSGIATVRWKNDVNGRVACIGARIVDFHDNSHERYQQYLTTLIARTKARDIMLKCDPLVQQTSVDPSLIFDESTNILQLQEQLGLAHGRYAAVTAAGEVVGRISVREILPYLAEYNFLRYQDVLHKYQNLQASLATDLATGVRAIRQFNRLSAQSDFDVTETIESICQQFESALFRGLTTWEGVSQLQIPVNKSLCDLEDILDQVAATFFPIASSLGLPMQLSFENAIPKIRGDAMRLEQAFTLFLLDILDEAQEGQKIVFGVTSNPTRVTVYLQCVHDDIDLPSLNRRRPLFGEARLTCRQPLMLAERMIAAHDGICEWFEDQGDQVFFFTLPIAEFQ